DITVQSYLQECLREIGLLSEERETDTTKAA
ncbi:hypothetical protein AVDCRST_MAG81-645, partial [uncultured Synechococcales cyanobacterium]